MSGLEIAGLLLGAIPTCATAIAEYNSTLDKIKRFRHWRLDLPRYVGILRRQRSELEETLRLLLFGMVDSDGLEIMIEDPVGSHWKNEALISKLKGKYREEYDIFEERIRDISSPMFKLTARLGLTKTEYVSKPEFSWISNLTHLNIDESFSGRWCYQEHEGRRWFVSHPEPAILRVRP